MQFDAFEQLGRDYWDRIPAEYKEGIDGVVVERRTQTHPAIRGVYTLGECVTENYPSAFGGPETTRSVVVLYYGSFERIARRDGAFDWEGELWETLTHELRHHLESLADDDALEDVDYAADENFKRLDGQPFDPWFYRNGEPVLPDTYALEGDVFIEHVWRGTRPRYVGFEWEDHAYHVHTPEDAGDVCFVVIVAGIEPPPLGELTLVLVRQTGWAGSVRAFLKGAKPRVREVERPAHPGIAPS